jgi:hypothetical protein
MNELVHYSGSQSIASTTARHAFVSATACLQMYPSPPSTE